MVPAALEAAWRKHKAILLVLTPTMHNPTTATMTARRRARHRGHHHQARADADRRRSVHLLEAGVQPLTALVPERAYLAASLSKCLAPGLRTSILVAPSADAAQRIAAALRALTQMPAPLMTAVAIRWMQNGSADAIIAAVRQEAAARQALSREVLGEGHFAAQPNSPHIWLPAPGSWSSERFSSLLRSRGLGVVATTHSPFHPKRRAASGRLSAPRATGLS